MTDKEWYTRIEAAAYLKVSPQTLANWALDEAIKLPYYKAGKKVQYKKADLDAFLEKCKVE